MGWRIALQRVTQPGRTVSTPTRCVGLGAYLENGGETAYVRPSPLEMEFCCCGASEVGPTPLSGKCAARPLACAGREFEPGSRIVSPLFREEVSRPRVRQ